MINESINILDSVIVLLTFGAFVSMILGISLIYDFLKMRSDNIERKFKTPAKQYSELKNGIAKKIILQELNSMGLPTYLNGLTTEHMATGISSALAEYLWRNPSNHY